MKETMNDTQTAPESAVWRNLYPLALGMMALPFWCLLVAVFGFIVWIPMTKYHLLVAFALTLGTIAWGCRWDWKKSVVQGVIFTVVTLLCAGYASLHSDVGRSDGPSYHKPAVIEMKHGWNPLWEYNSDRDAECLVERNGVQRIIWGQDRWWYWSKHYPKSDWYINAVFYTFSGNLDLGFLSRMFYLFVTFIVVFVAVASIFHLPGYQCFLMSLIAVLNPQAIRFCFHSEIDGVLGSLLTILFFAIAAYLKNKDKRFLPLVIACIVIATNLKFTGVVYVAVFLICMLIPYAVLGIRAKKPLDRTFTGSLVLATVLALVAGINPYLHHLYHHYTPFYPLHTVRKIDKLDRQDIMKKVTECNVGDANNLQQFFFHYLNTSDPHSCNPRDWEGKPHGVHAVTVNKIPFALQDHPFRFGSFFMVAMWFSLLMVPLIRHKEFWFLLLAVWASIWIQPEIWYGRYIPHLWLIPIVVACALLSQFSGVVEYRRRFIVIVGTILFCMFVSAMPFIKWVEPRVKSGHFGVIAYFVQKHSNALFFDIDGVYLPFHKYGIKNYISDWIPGYSFDSTDNLPSQSTRLERASFLCPVYLVADDQEELDRLASIKPSRTEMTKAILHLRWQQFKRAWGD